MNSESDMHRELEEVNRQLRAVEVEIDRMTKEIVKLDERVLAAEREALAERTEPGQDTVEIIPTRELRDALTRRDQNLGALEKLNRRKREIEERAQKLHLNHLETTLLQETRRFTALERREEELGMELETVRAEKAKVQQRKEDLALELARLSEAPSEG